MKSKLLAVAVLAAVVAPLFGAPEAHAKDPVRFPCGVGMVQHGNGIQLAGFTVAPALASPALFRSVDIKSPQVKLDFIGHATFLIQSPQGVKVVTDYNYNYDAEVVPHIATMNIERGNHSRDQADPGVRHVLRGWDSGEGIPNHEVRLKDMRVYNIPTNVETFSNRATNYSSIFVIEAAGVCISHMGHLAHVLDKDRVRQLGRIDVLLLPVDRQVTQSMDELLENVSAIKPRVIVPMHFNSMFTVEDFAKQIEKFYPVKRPKGSTLDVARAGLPATTEVWIVKPRLINPFGGSQL
ncbi:MAG: MBL fold metallo-hydrolase [Proteobacteria bacterium]|nr:MBL fold metallo-hydrolase [Pseudomonadota bacterium]